jgi:hypothetical protein
MLKKIIERLTAFTQKSTPSSIPVERTSPTLSVLSIVETVKEQLQIVNRARPVIEPSWTPGYASSIFLKDVQERAKATKLLNDAIRRWANVMIDFMPISAWSWASHNEIRVHYDGLALYLKSINYDGAYAGVVGGPSEFYVISNELHLVTKINNAVRMVNESKKAKSNH